ncbi:MAG: DNA gyrase C-terminal beta-propeller domain-containing protein, partial [Ectothiorhodospiraceae bacterium]
PPAMLADPDSDELAVLSTAGRLLVFPAAELPYLVRGKGNKIMGIPPASVKARDEVVQALRAVPAGGGLALTAGKRTLTLRPGDLATYRSARGKRGILLPRGLQRVTAVQTVPPADQ